MEAITAEDKGLLDALHKLKIATPEELEKTLESKAEIIKEKVYVEKSNTSGKYPRISLFYGEPSKGEVSYRTWQYEVNCLIKADEYTQESILHGIRRSLRGEAADMTMRLGETASVKDILISLHTAFGNTETAESILKRFHGCSQKEGESVSCYASRVEELFSQAVELGALERKQQLILKSVFYEGLDIDLKVASAYKYETIDNYNAFKAEIRNLETILSKTKSASSPGKGQIPCQQVTRQDNSELGEIKDMLKKFE